MTASPRSPSSPERRIAHLVLVAAVALVGAVPTAVLGPDQRPSDALEQTHAVRQFQHTFVDPARVSCRGGLCTVRSLPTRFYAPDDTQGPYPIVLFAHGFATNPAHYDTLLRRIAAAGFLVVAPDLPEAVVPGPGSPTRLHTANQARDLLFLLDQLTALVIGGAGDWAGVARLDHPTVAGHSDGGIVAAALVETPLADPRIAGAVVIAGEEDPAVGPWAPHNGRVLVVHGTADTIAPFSRGQAVYDDAANPRALLSGIGRGHDGVILDPDAAPARDAIVGWLDWVARFDVSGLGRFWTNGSAPGFTLAATDGIDMSPVGVFESATPSGAGGDAVVSGWAMDPSTTAEIAIRIVVDADPASAAVLGTGGPRPDVGAVWKNGDTHGFSAMVGMAEGPHQICITAIDVGAGNDRLIGCREVTIPPLPPPGAPVGVAATPFSGSAVVHWQPRPPDERVISHTVTCSCGQTRTVDGGARSTSFAALTDGTAVTFTVTASNRSGPSVPSAPVTVTPTDSQAGLVVVAPTRVFDTRDVGSAMQQRQTRQVDLAPPPGAIGVVVSLTALDPAQETFLTVSPAGIGPGDVSSLNLAPGAGPVSNQVVVPLGAGGDVEVFNNSGTVHALLDVMGWMVADAGADPGAGRVPVAPTRLLDTRVADQLPAGPGSVRTVHVAPPGAIVAAGLVVTTTGASHDSFITAWGTGDRPFASIQNPRPGFDRAANVVVPVDGNGDVHLFNNSGTVDLVVDHTSSFLPGPAPTTQRWHPQAPWRLTDSRAGDGPLVPGVARAVPAGGATLQANVVATDTTGFGHLTVWSTGPWPGTSNLNFRPGTTVAQQVVAGDASGLTVLASGACHVVIDVSGYWA